MPAYADIKRLVGILTAMRDPFNHHGSRTAAFAVSLATAMGLPPAEVDLIGVGAELHDIGKLFIRPELLNAERKFSDIERAEIETHTTLGWAVANEAGYDQIIRDIIRHHHERWDGKGYPDGLAGNDIPMSAQITGICDVYEAMTSKRSYRDAFSHPVAMAFVQKDKRTKFNSEITDLFFAKVAHG